MINDVLSHAATELRNYLANSDFQASWHSGYRERIEALIVEMDAICALPGLDTLPEGTLEARDEALEEWSRERSCLQEDEEAEIAAEAIKPMKPRPDDWEQNEEPDEDLWPD